MQSFTCTKRQLKALLRHPSCLVPRGPLNVATATLAKQPVASRGEVLVRAAGRMEPAEVARTITSLVTYGTLSSVSADGTPLGTFVTFVLDDNGCPLIRLRADAAHTANLRGNKRCTIFAHASEKPARDLARVTLVGEVEDVGEEEASDAALRHAALYSSAIGVDAPQPDDIFMRLNVDECFYVAGLGVRALAGPSAAALSGCPLDVNTGSLDSLLVCEDVRPVPHSLLRQHEHSALQRRVRTVTDSGGSQRRTLGKALAHACHLEARAESGRGSCAARSTTIRMLQCLLVGALTLQSCAGSLRRDHLGRCVLRSLARRAEGRRGDAGGPLQQRAPCRGDAHCEHGYGRAI